MTSDEKPKHASPRHVTIVDVARVANVAPSPASRALHESPRVSDATKRRVRAAARLSTPARTGSPARFA